MFKQTLKQKKIEKSINELFNNIDDEYLKACLLISYCGYPENYIDDIIEQQREQNEMYKQFIEQVDNNEKEQTKEREKEQEIEQTKEQN